MLPGELEGRIDPEDYGFGVIREELPSDAELAERVAMFYAIAKRRTGATIPALEPYLDRLSITGLPVES